MVGALKALGVQLEERWEQQEAVVVGCGGRFPVQGAELFLGNAGTAMRCVAAAASAPVSLAWRGCLFRCTPPVQLRSLSSAGARLAQYVCACSAFWCTCQCPGLAADTGKPRTVR